MVAEPLHDDVPGKQIPMAQGALKRQVRDQKIRADYLTGLYTTRELAAKYGLRKTRIGVIVCGMLPFRPFIARLMRKTDTTARGCWVVDVKRYSVLARDGESDYAHRLVFKAFFGSIPMGMDVLHKCDNPPCWRPSHLFVGTPIDNARDAMQKGRLFPPQVYIARKEAARGCRAV